MGELDYFGENFRFYFEKSQKSSKIWKMAKIEFYTRKWISGPSWYYNYDFCKVWHVTKETKKEFYSNLKWYFNTLGLFTSCWGIFPFVFVKKRLFFRTYSIFWRKWLEMVAPNLEIQKLQPICFPTIYNMCMFLQN